MAHNVWTHIHAVQEANRQYDFGKFPDMLLSNYADKKTFRQYNHQYFKDIVNDIFATSDKGKALALIEEYNRYWLYIIGTRGAIGKKTVNSKTNYNKFFDDDSDLPDEEQDNNLNKLEADLND